MIKKCWYLDNVIYDKPTSMALHVAIVPVSEYEAQREVMREARDELHDLSLDHMDYNCNAAANPKYTCRCGLAERQKVLTKLDEILKEVE